MIKVFKLAEVSILTFTNFNKDIISAVWSGSGFLALSGQDLPRRRASGLWRVDDNED